jgi:hypothetical protein
VSGARGDREGGHAAGENELTAVHRQSPGKLHGRSMRQKKKMGTGFLLSPSVSQDPN